MAKLVNLTTPPGSRIFCYACPHRPIWSATRWLVTRARSAMRFEDMLFMPSDPNRQPLKRVTLTFPRQMVSRLRVSLARSKPDKVWAVHEMRVMNAGKEVPRSPAWRTNAYPDPWEASFAFDNNPATRWSSEQFGSAGAFLEIDFDKPIAVDSVVIECAPKRANNSRFRRRFNPGKRGWFNRRRCH